MEKTFYAQSQTQEQFFQTINNWFAENRNIRIKNIYTSATTSVGFLVNKSNLSNITLIYEEDNSINALYGISYLEKFALIQIDAESMRDAWQKANPHLQVVTYSYRNNMRGQTGSLVFNGIGANNRNQIWVIYKAKPAAPKPAPQTETTAQVNPKPQTETIAQVDPKPQTQPVQTAEPPRKAFCSECGAKLAEGAKFCSACGKRV